MIGELIRGYGAGRRSSKAWQIIMRVTGETPDIQHLNNLALRYSNEYEVALSYMIIYCADMYDDLGRQYSSDIPDIRKKVLKFFDECTAKNFIYSENIKNFYNNIKLDIFRKETPAETENHPDSEQHYQANIKESYRNEPIVSKNTNNFVAASGETIKPPIGNSDSPVIRPTFRPPPLERPTTKPAVAENQKQETSNVSSLANARLSGINSTELQRLTFSSLLAAGISGDPEAQFALGVKYEIGDGVEDNCVEAARWYLKSAKQGYGRAQFNLALCYESGLGVNLDWKKAAELFILAANAGVEEAPKHSSLLALKVAQREQLKNIEQNDGNL